jgi:hypothetical protein
MFVFPVGLDGAWSPFLVDPLFFNLVESNPASDFESSVYRLP